MREHINADSLYAEILLVRTLEVKVVLVVEGSNDFCALQPHINDRSVRLLIASGKIKALQLMSIVTRTGMQGVAALVDRDFDAILSTTTLPANVIQTDYYDLDTTIFFTTGLFSRVVAQISDHERRADHAQRTEVADPLRIVTRLASPVSCLRLVSLRDQMGLPIAKVSIHELADSAEGRVDVSRLVTAAVTRCPTDCDLEVAEIVREVAQLHATHANDPLYLCGHDLHAALAFVAVAEWGGRTKNKEDVARMFRAALDCESLRNYRFFQEINDWAAGLNVMFWTC